MARQMKTRPEIVMLRKESGLEGIVHCQWSRTYSSCVTYLERKCGSNCKPGININAGKVIRLNTPKTMMKDRIVQERRDMRF